MTNLNQSPISEVRAHLTVTKTGCWLSVSDSLGTEIATAEIEGIETEFGEDQPMPITDVSLDLMLDAHMNGTGVRLVPTENATWAEQWWTLVGLDCATDGSGDIQEAGFHLLRD